MEKKNKGESPQINGLHFLGKNYSGHRQDIRKRWDNTGRNRRSICEINFVKTKLHIGKQTSSVVYLHCNVLSSLLSVKTAWEGILSPRWRLSGSGSRAARKATSWLKLWMRCIAQDHDLQTSSCEIINGSTGEFFGIETLIWQAEEEQRRQGLHRGLKTSNAFPC